MTPSTHPQKHRPGFTTLEVIVVLGIIGAILGGMNARLGQEIVGARQDQVLADMRTIEAALLKYKITSGVYPTNNQGLEALVEKPAGVERWAPVFDKVPLDPWGNPYRYKFPGSIDKTKPEILSNGPDLQPGTADDISSQDE